VLVPRRRRLPDDRPASVRRRHAAGRKLVAADNPNDAIFASRRGTWLSPNMSVASGARPAPTPTWIGLPHTPSETVATLIDKEADTKSAAAQLGHASEEVTDTYYIAKPVLAPDVSEILEQLGGVMRGPPCLGPR
jgi:integrase